MEYNSANVVIILSFSITTLLIQEFDLYMAKDLDLDWVHTTNLFKTMKWNQLNT